MNSISVQDTLKEIDFSKVEKYYLLSKDRETRIVVTNDVINFPSLRKRCQLFENNVNIVLDTNDITILCGIANLCSGYNTSDRLGNMISFIQYSCDDELLKRLAVDMEKFHHVYTEVADSINQYNEPDSDPVEIEGTDIKFVPYFDSVTKPKNPKAEFAETLTSEQCEKLPVNYLLSHVDRCKYAFSHPRIYDVDLNLLGCAIVQMWNKELYFAATGDGSINLFTNEYENLPRLNINMNEESPYKPNLVPGPKAVIPGKNIRYKPLNYHSLLDKTKRVMNADDTVKRFLMEGYGVVSGSCLNPLGPLHITTIHLCLKNKNMLKDALPLFAEYKRIDKLDKQKIVFQKNWNKIVLYIPNISHIHHVASKPFSIHRMFFDGNTIYMTLSCMLTFVNGMLVNVNTYTGTYGKVKSLLDAGFSFVTDEVRTIIDGKSIEHKTLDVIPLQPSSLYEGYNDGILKSESYSEDLILF